MPPKLNGVPTTGVAPKKKANRQSSSISTSSTSSSSSSSSSLRSPSSRVSRPKSSPSSSSSSSRVGPKSPSSSSSSSSSSLKPKRASPSSSSSTSFSSALRLRNALRPLTTDISQFGDELCSIPYLSSLPRVLIELISSYARIEYQLIVLRRKANQYELIRCVLPSLTLSSSTSSTGDASSNAPTTGSSPPQVRQFQCDTIGIVLGRQLTNITWHIPHQSLYLLRLDRQLRRLVSFPLPLLNNVINTNANGGSLEDNNDSNNGNNDDNANPDENGMETKRLPLLSGPDIHALAHAIAVGGVGTIPIATSSRIDPIHNSLYRDWNDVGPVQLPGLLAERYVGIGSSPPWHSVIVPRGAATGRGSMTSSGEYEMIFSPVRHGHDDGEQSYLDGYNLTTRQWTRYGPYQHWLGSLHCVWNNTRLYSFPLPCCKSTSAFTSTNSVSYGYWSLTSPTMEWVPQRRYLGVGEWYHAMTLPDIGILLFPHAPSLHALTAFPIFALYLPGEQKYCELTWRYPIPFAYPPHLINYVNGSILVFTRVTPQGSSADTRCYQLPLHQWVLRSSRKPVPSTSPSSSSSSSSSSGVGAPKKYGPHHPLPLIIKEEDWILLGTLPCSLPSAIIVAEI